MNGDYFILMVVVSLCIVSVSSGLLKDDAASPRILFPLCLFCVCLCLSVYLFVCVVFTWRLLANVDKFFVSSLLLGSFIVPLLVHGDHSCWVTCDSSSFAPSLDSLFIYKQQVLFLIPVL